MFVTRDWLSCIQVWGLGTPTSSKDASQTPAYEGKAIGPSYTSHACYISGDVETIGRVSSLVCQEVWVHRYIIPFGNTL